MSGSVPSQVAVAFRALAGGLVLIVLSIGQVLASLVGCLIPFLILGLMMYVGGLLFWLIVGLIASLFE